MSAEAYVNELSVPFVCHRGVKAYDPASGSSLKPETANMHASSFALPRVAI